MKLNNQFVDFSKQDMDRLLKAKYDAYWTKTVNSAIPVDRVEDIPSNSDKAYRISYLYFSRLECSNT